MSVLVKISIINHLCCKLDSHIPNAIKLKFYKKLLNTYYVFKRKLKFSQVVIVKHRISTKSLIYLATEYLQVA